MTDQWRDVQRALAIVGVVCVILLTALVLGFGGGALMAMGEDDQGGRYYLGAVIVFALLCLLDQYLKLAKRFRR